MTCLPGPEEEVQLVERSKVVRIKSQPVMEFGDDPWDSIFKPRVVKRAKWRGFNLKIPRSGSSPALARSEGDTANAKGRGGRPEGGDGQLTTLSSPSTAFKALTESGSFSSNGALVAWSRLAGFSKSFLKRSPRDCMGGIAGGVKSMTLGVSLGLTGLVAAPTIGANNYGLKGFVAGLSAGLAGVVVLPVAGMLGGLTYVVGGVVNTPFSVVNMAKGRQWDPILQRWVRYDLKEEASRLLNGGKEEEGIEEDLDREKNETPAGDNQQTDGRIQTVDSSLYDVLGVAPSASAEAIKKAYYRAALEVHPDRRGPCDVEGKERFQKLAEAYQVLSTPDLRAAYDKEGMKVCDDATFIDADLFFGILFGSERFRPYLGKLFLATAIGALSKVSVVGDDLLGLGVPVGFAGEEHGIATVLGDTQRRITEAQAKREVRCAVHLVRLLRPLIEGRSESFTRFCQAEALDLSEKSLGPLILREVGTVYRHVAKEYLGGMAGLAASVNRCRVKMQRQAEVAGATIDAIRLGKRFCDVYSPGSSSKSEGLNRVAASAPDLRRLSRKRSNDLPSTPSTTCTTPGSVSPDYQPWTPEVMARQAEDGGQTPYSPTNAEEQLEADGLPRLVSIVWKLAAYDIQETVGRACGKILSDTSVSKEERKLRAKGLMELGQAFKARADVCIKAAGGHIDYSKEWEALDREMLQRYESSASIHSMRTNTSSSGFSRQSGEASQTHDRQGSSGLQYEEEVSDHEENDDQHAEQDQDEGEDEESGCNAEVNKPKYVY